MATKNSAKIVAYLSIALLAIIVKFVRRDGRDEFYKARKNLRKKTTKDVGLRRTSEHNIYISQSLTKRNRDLFNDCLKARKVINFKYAWTQGGKIIMRKDHNSVAISNLNANKSNDPFSVPTALTKLAKT